MNLAKLQPGDHLECNVRGLKFLATLRSKSNGVAEVIPDSRNVTYRRIPSRQVVRRVEHQGKFGVGT